MEGVLEEEQAEVEMELIREGKMSDKTYYRNIVVQSILWTQASFTFYCLNFMNKYMEGSIFTNYYLEGLAGLIAASLSLPVYKYFRIKWSLLSSYASLLVCFTLLFLFQQQWVSSHWITVFGSPESGHAQGSKEDNEFHLKTLVPALIFMIKLLNGFSFSYLNICTYSSDAIFPFYIRATSIGMT